MALTGDYKNLFNNAMTGVTGYVSTTANGGKVNTGDIVQFASNMLANFFASLGENEKEADEETAKLNDINKSSETTKKNTDKAVNEFNQEINELQKAIEDNLKLVEQKNQEKDKIQEDLQKQTEIIVNAQNILNTSKDGKERCQAIRDLQSAKAVIKDLVTRSAKLVKEIEAGIGEIQEYQTKTEKYTTKANEAVEAGQSESEQLVAEAADLSQKSTVTAQKGEQEITQGEIKAAAGTATSMFGGSTEAAQGAAMIAEGTYTVGKTAVNISKITMTAGQIHSNLASMTTDKVSIGDVANNMKSITEQVQSAWGVIGIWTQEYSQTLSGEQATYSAAVDNAAEKVNKELSDNRQNSEHVTSQNNANHADSQKDGELPQYTLGDDVDVKDTFVYDGLSKLQNLL